MSPDVHAGRSGLILTRVQGPAWQRWTKARSTPPLRRYSLGPRSNSLACSHEKVSARVALGDLGTGRPGVVSGLAVASLITSELMTRPLLTLERMRERSAASTPHWTRLILHLSLHAIEDVRTRLRTWASRSGSLAACHQLQQEDVAVTSQGTVGGSPLWSSPCWAASRLFRPLSNGLGKWTRTKRCAPAECRWETATFRASEIKPQGSQ